MTSKLPTFATCITRSLLRRRDVHQKTNSIEVCRSYSSSKDSTTHFEELYPVENVKDLPIHVQERMYYLQDKAGYIPNLLRAFAHRPDYFRCLLECHDSISDRPGTNVTKADRELIGIVVSQINKCNYGLVAHSSLFRKYTDYDIKVGEKEVEKFVSGKSMDLRHQLIAKTARTVARAQPVDEERLVQLEEIGLDSEDIWDVVAFASLISMINRMSRFLRVQPNVEFYNEGFSKPKMVYKSISRQKKKSQKSD